MLVIMNKGYPPGNQGPLATKNLRGRETGLREIADPLHDGRASRDGEMCNANGTGKRARYDV